MRIRFEWDDAKAKINLEKHNVTFEIAIRIFCDPFTVMVQDRIEGGEYRGQTLGLVDGHLLLQVAHTVSEEEDENGSAIEVIRIISARRATRKERQRYENQDRSS